ncbi:MAG: class II aldolase/adducin family protein [Rhodospirillaceae bacterium]
MDTLAHTNNDARLKADVIVTCCALSQRGLTHGTSGNVSVRRDGETFFISPTGVPYEQLNDIPLMDFTGRWYGNRRPSSEWRFHRDILKARPDVNAIVHTHSKHAVALACTGQGIPAFHYMVAIAGGADIRCAPYATFGSQALSNHAVAALEDRKACLLANHGVIATGADLAGALRLAGEVENLAAQYCAALAAGKPDILSEAEMSRVITLFRSYGKQDSTHDPDLVFAGSERP